MEKISHTGKPGKALALFTFTVSFVPVHFVLYYFVCSSSFCVLMFRLSKFIWYFTLLFVHFIIQLFIFQRLSHRIISVCWSSFRGQVTPSLVVFSSVLTLVKLTAAVKEVGVLWSRLCAEWWVYYCYSEHTQVFVAHSFVGSGHWGAHVLLL